MKEADRFDERQAIARGRVEDPTVTPAQGEAAVAACLAPLRGLLRGGEDAALLDTLVIYLLDGVPA